MSTDNVATAEALYEILARGELSDVAHLLTADVEYVNPAGAIEPGTRSGVSAFVAAAESVQQAWERWRMHPELFVPAAEKVAVVMRYEATARASGVRVEGRESALLTFRDGKVARYEWFQGPEDALEAIGATNTGQGD